MKSRLPGCRLSALWLLNALIIASLSGCYGDSEFGLVEQPTDETVAGTDEQTVPGNIQQFGDEIWAEQALDLSLIHISEPTRPY